MSRGGNLGIRPVYRRCCFAFALTFITSISVLRCPAAELRKETIVAFDRYVKATEARMNDELQPSRSFLYPDRLDAENRRAIYDQLRRGDVFVTQLSTTREGHSIPVPKGIIHHWVGVAFIPHTGLADAVRIAQDYGHRTEVYK